MEAQEWCRKYMKSGNVKDLTQAWDLYYHVFRRISKQLPQVGGEVHFRVGLTVQVVNTNLCFVFSGYSKHSNSVFWKYLHMICCKFAAYAALPASIWSIDDWLNCSRSLDSMNSSDVSVRFKLKFWGIVFLLFLLAHFSGTTVRVTKTLNVPGPGIGSARNVWSQPAHHTHSVHCTLTAGHHLQAAAQEVNTNG